MMTVAVISLIACIGLWTVNDYGITLDERWEIAAVGWNMQLLMGSRDSIPGNMGHYGLFFNIVTLIPNFIHSILSSHSMITGVFDGLKDGSLIFLKHKTSFIFNLIGFVSVAGIVRIFLGWSYSWIGPAILALMPTFWGHLFNNPKDAPFACFFTVCTLFGSYLVTSYFKSYGRIGIGLNKLTYNSIAFGILVGLFAGIRLAGLILICFVFFTHFIVLLARRNFITMAQALRLAGHYVLIIFTSLLVGLIWYPSFWAEPIKHVLETLAYLSTSVWIGPVLFNGHIIRNDELPWFYLPVWVLISIPIVILIGFILGTILCAVRFKRLSILQQSCFLLILLQIFALPVVAIIKRTAIQDGMRHFLFILPGMAALCAICIGYLTQSMKGKHSVFRFTFCFALTILFLNVLFDMFSLHPYQSVYFNEIARKDPNIGLHYETDYLGSSARASAEWINKHVPEGSTIVYDGWSWHALEPLLKSGLHLFPDSDFRTAIGENKSFYYVAYPRADLLTSRDPFPECKTVFQVTRRLPPAVLHLSRVKRCDGHEILPLQTQQK